MANMASERAGRGLDARNVVLGLLLAACVGLSGASMPTALAQAAGEVPMEQLLPSDVLFVLSAPNLSASKERFKGTALSKIWNEPEVQQFLQGPLAKLREAIEKLKTQAQAEPGINLDEVKALFTGQLTFALLDIRFEDKRRGIPEAAFVAGISDPAKFRQILALIEAKAKEKAAAQGKPLREEKLQIAGVDVTAFTPEEGIALCYAVARNMFIATVGKAAMEKMLTGATGGHGKPLAKEASFARMVSRLGESKPEALLFVNVAALLDKLEPQMPDQAKQVIYELGLRGLEGAGGALAFEGRGVRSVLYVHAPHERRGLTKLMSSEPVDKNLLKIIPQTATSGSITRFELAGIWTLVEDIAASVGDQQYRTFQQFVAQAEAGLQMKIKDDLCASLGDEIIAYSALPTTPSPLAMIGDVAILLSVRDRDKAQMCADKVLREVARLAGQQIRGKMPPPPPGGQGGQPQPQGPQWNQQEFGGYNISYVTFPGLPLPIFPSYVVTEKYLILSLSPQTVKNVLTQLKTPGPDVTANPDFKDVTGRIPQTYSALSYTDMKRSFETMYPMAQMFLPMIMTQVQLPIDVAKLPQVQTISQHLFGSANCTVSDPEGITITGYSVAGGVGVAALAGGIGAGMVLPALTRARTQARASVCQSNLKQIGLAYHMYKADHQDQGPPNLDALTQYIKNKRVFKCPQDPNPAETAPSYQYVGPLPKEARPDAVVAYDIAPRHNGRRNVLFHDGHVETVPEQRFQTLVQKAKAQ